jgi:outer membrane protein, multidrug efflux system
MKRQTILAFLLAASTLAHAGGPKYKKPDVSVPQAWQTEAPWAAAEPKDALPKGKWWTIFGDAELNSYEDQALANNQTLQAAVARLAEARAFARVTQSGLYPELDLQPSVSRQRVSANRPNLTSTLPHTSITQNVFAIPFTLNYEVDLFGGVRNNVASAQASLQATAADLENVRLLVTAELAADYFLLRSLDSEIAVVQRVIAFDQQGLDLVNRRHVGGTASGLDVAQQQTVIDAAITQLELLHQQRDQFQHAVATLQGLPASVFKAPPRELETKLPAIPLTLPADLLQRRPDIAAAERRVSAANSQIGVARSAFFPNIVLGAQAGLQSTGIANLFSSPSALWSIGLSALEPVFAGGRVRARYQQSHAVYDEAVANYRETVLVSFQQVEDALSALNALGAAADSQQRAVDDSTRSLQLASDRYTGGLVTYLDVITAQEQLLANERLATQLYGQRVVTSVYLVKALGGSWNDAELKSVPVKATLKQAVTQ